MLFRVMESMILRSNKEISSNLGLMLARRGASDTRGELNLVDK